MLVKKTQLMQQGENTGLKSELTELKKESAEMKTDIHKLQTKLQLVEKESEEMKTKLQLVEKENTDLKSALIELRKVISSSMDPQLKDQVVNTFKLGSIEEDVQMNKEDIIDLRINVGHHDMQIGQMLNQINNMNTTLNGEIVKLDERVGEQLTNVEDLVSGLQQEVGIVEADIGAIRDDVNTITADIAAMDGRLSKAEVRSAICGNKKKLEFSSSTTLTFDRVYDEVDSSTGGELQTDGYFTAGVAGIYFIKLETSVQLDQYEELHVYLVLSSGNYAGDGAFTYSYNSGGSRIDEQASASRYVSMSAGETLHISLDTSSEETVFYTTMCVSLYSASG